MPALSLILLLAASRPAMMTVQAPSFDQPSASAASPAATAASPVATAAPRPAPEASAVTPPGSAPGPHDRAGNLAGGVWQCETVAGNTGTQTYTVDENDGSMELQTALRDGFRTFNITEVYRFDAAHNLWSVQTAGGAFSGTAPPWTLEKWIFEGSANANGQRRPVRMVYFDLGRQAFRRDFQARQDGVWRTYSAETCLRPSA